MLKRRLARGVTVGMANKTARIGWSVMARGEV